MSFGASKDLETLAKMVLDAALKSPQHSRYAQLCLERLLVMIKPEISDHYQVDQHQASQTTSWEFGNSNFQANTRNYNEDQNSNT